MSITNNYFCVLDRSIVTAAEYQNAIIKNRVEENILDLGKREVCFGDYQKFIGNGDWCGNLLEHLHLY